MSRTATTLSILALAFAVAGCGLADPYAGQQQGQRPRARPAEPPRRVRPSARDNRARPQPGVRAAVRAFARAWTNWGWRTIDRSEHLRAELAAGPLRARLLADAAAARDPTLARERLASRGRVVAIDVQATGRAYVVVRETTTHAGLEAIGDSALHVYRARCERERGGWLVSAWAELG